MAQFNTWIVEYWKGSKPCAQTMSYRMKPASICYWCVLVCPIHLWYVFPSHYVGGIWEVSGHQSRSGAVPQTPHMTEICWGNKPFTSVCLPCIHRSLLTMYSIILPFEQCIARTKEFTSVWSKKWRKLYEGQNQCQLWLKEQSLNRLCAMSCNPLDKFHPG